MSPRTRSREEFAAELNRLKGASKYSYNALASEIGRPASTVHGWCTGKHLPYPRDNEVFEQLLRTFGVDDTGAWMSELFELRSRGSDAAADQADADTAMDGTSNPYRGLEPFTEADAELFHGRNAVIDRLWASVLRRLDTADSSPVMVIGASGSGKTSVLRAGLRARLSERPDVEVHVLRPGEHPEASLAGLPPFVTPSPTQPRASRVVIIDQFEELFAADPEVISAVDGTIDDLRSAPGTAVVIGMRADFFHRAAAVPTLLEGLQADPVIVGPMSFDEATDCIVKPAAAAGLTVAPDLLVELIAEFAQQVRSGGSTEALPLLSHVLRLLAEQPDDGQLTVARYREIGGIGHALERTADDVYESLDSDEQITCKELFAQLVELGNDALPTRRTASLTELTAAAPHHDFDGVIAEFADRRLLTTDRDTVTISHEALLSAWPRIAQWIDDERQALLAVRRIAAAAATWTEHDEDPGALLRGGLLDMANVVMATPARSRLSADEQQYIRISHAAELHRIQTDREILSRQLSMQATMLRDLDPPLSAQIAVVAHRTAPTVDTRSALLSATSPLPGGRYLGGPGPSTLHATPDGRRAVFTNALDGTVTVLDAIDDPTIEASDLPRYARAGEVTFTQPGSAAYGIAISADGSTVVVGASSGELHLIDLANGVDDPRVVDLADPRFVVHGPIYSVTWASASEFYTVGAANGIARWMVDRSPTGDRAPTVHLVEMIADDRVAMSVRTNSTGLLACSYFDGTVTLRHIDNPGVVVWSDTSPDESAAAAIGLAADGSQLFVGYFNGTIRAWRLAVDDHAAPADEHVHVDEIPLVAAPFATWINAAAYSPGGQFVAAASSDGSVRMWDTTTWHETTQPLRHPTIVTGVHFGSGSTLITAAEDGAARIWNIAPIYAAAPKRFEQSLPTPTASTAGAPDRTRVVTSPRARPTVASSTIWSTSFDDAGRLMVAGARPGALVHRIGDDGTMSLEHEIEVSHDCDRVLSSASCISPDGSMVVLGTRQGSLLIAPTATLGTTSWLDRVDGLTGLIEYVTFSPDGSLLAAAATDGIVQFWAVDTDGRLRIAGSVNVAPPALGVAVAADNSLAAVASEAGHVRIIDIRDVDRPIECAAFDTGNSFTLCVAFHPTLPIVAAGNADRTVTLWDCSGLLDAAPTRPGAPSEDLLLERLSGPGGHVISLDFARDGSRLAAGLTDGRVWLWDTDDLEHITHRATINSGGQGVYTVAFSPDGSHLVGAGPHRRVQRWTLDDDDATFAILDAVGDPITAEEWSAYIPTIPYTPPRRR